MEYIVFFFFFQAEDGIRDGHVTGVQTCALPISPIRQKRWCPTHEREVGPDEIVKGWEVAKGEFVIVEDADLEAITLHDDSRSIDITRFVELDEVDPVYLDRTYYLAPASAAAQRRPYVLLLEAMKQAGMGGIGRFV